MVKALLDHSVVSQLQHYPHSRHQLVSRPQPLYPGRCCPSKTKFQSHFIISNALSADLEADSAERNEYDVSGAVVNPVFRSTPWEAEAQRDTDGAQVRVLFVSESGVCRSQLAAAIMTELLEANDLGGAIQCESRASKDYNIGDPPDPTLQQVAQELDLRLPEGAAARFFDHERDIVNFDLVLVFDKFCAADVLREVSVYDTISKSGNYSVKVRMLGQYHGQLGARKEPDAQDIDDPLYGNVGGEEEKEAVLRTAMIISEACNGLLSFLQDTKRQGEERGVSFRKALALAISELEQIDWLVPPMLQKG